MKPAKKTLTDTEKGLLNESPLCVNLQRLTAYLLPTDEIIFFEWLTVKQFYVFGFLPFYYSNDRITKEIHINRKRLEVIIKRFVAMGILRTETSYNTSDQRGGKRKTYFVNFANVLRKLQEIIDQEHELSQTFADFFRMLNKLQTEAAKSTASKGKSGTKRKSSQRKEQGTKEIAAEADRIYKAITATFESRCKIYNDQQEERKQRGGTYEFITPTMLARDKATNKALARLTQRYNDDTINMAFLAFADTLIDPGKRESSNESKILLRPLYNFTRYDPQTDSYPTFEKYLSVFQRAYRIKGK